MENKDIVFSLIEQERKRQREGLELIPSENYASKAVMLATGSVLTNKYSEGYPSFEGLEGDEGKIIEGELENFRYYGGQEYIDKIERLAIARAKKIFGADHANVQPHSGANANEAVYFAWCETGDKILAMKLKDGGHLTHGAPVTRSAKNYKFINYGVDDSGEINYEELEKLALEEKPKIILVGYSAFVKIPDFERVAKIGEKIGALLMADMSHVAGLIAGGIHPNPLRYGFHVMTTTTHKTLRGPRGGLILSMGKVGSPLKKTEKKLENIPTLIDRAVFPGIQGGPLEHLIAGKAVAFGEILNSDFKDYAEKIIKNASDLAEFLKEEGFILYGNGTKNHMILIDMWKSFGINGKVYEKALDKVGLTLNANSLPYDKGSLFLPSGVRLGTPAITTRGMGEEEMKKIAKMMGKVARLCKEEKEMAKNDEKMKEIKKEVEKLALSFPIYE